MPGHRGDPSMRGLSSPLRAILVLGCWPRTTAYGLTATVSTPRRRRAVLCSLAGVQPALFANAFSFSLADGLCTAVELPGDLAVTSSPAVDELHPRERDLLADMQPHRQLTYAGGRIAIRRALKAIGAEAAASEAVLSGSTGAPTIFDGALGSISHTSGLAAAFVRPLPHERRRAGSRATSLQAVGIDVERTTRAVPLKLASRVLSEHERGTLGHALGLPADADLLLRISLKEALYKALHPLVRRPIRWHSVQVHPSMDGSCRVDTSMLEDQVAMQLVADASWRVCGEYYVSTATVCAPSGDTGVVSPTKTRAGSGRDADDKAWPRARLS